MVFEEAVVTHGIEATCASPNGIEAKCASPRWRPNPEIDWHRDRYPRDMINPAGRNHVNRQRSPSSNANILIGARVKRFIFKVSFMIYLRCKINFLNVFFFQKLISGLNFCFFFLNSHFLSLFHLIFMLQTVTADS